MDINAFYEEIAVQEQIDKATKQLKGDLAKFGGHTAECDSLKIYYMAWKGEGQEQVLRQPAPQCNCGYTEAKERWE